jgi:hypothetical protein
MVLTSGVKEEKGFKKRKAGKVERGSHILFLQR